MYISCTYMDVIIYSAITDVRMVRTKWDLYRDGLLLYPYSELEFHTELCGQLQQQMISGN